jgi:phosphonate transport system substrate-binding protein
LSTSVALLALPHAAHADWRDQIGTFRIGIVAEPGAGHTVPGLALLTDAYGKALGMKVEFVVAHDYAALIEAQATARIQYAVYSATAYATALERCGCVEPLVAPVDADGATGIRSVLLTRDSKLPDLAAMQTHRIAMAPSDNIGGSLLPLAGLAADGIKISQDAPFLTHAGSAAAAEAMLVDGQADAVFGWERATAENRTAITGDQSADPDGTAARLEAAGIPKAALQIIWTSDVLRYGPHAVRSDLDPEAKRRLTVFLTNLRSQSPEVYDFVEAKHSGGFTSAAAGDYSMATAIVRLLSDSSGQ